MVWPYTWRDEFYTGIEGISQDDRFQQDFGTLDANIGFNFNDHLSAVVEATNILEEVDQDRCMPIDLTGFYTDNGRRRSASAVRSENTPRGFQTGRLW